MSDQLGFVAKVVLLSGAIALVIKFAAPQLSIPATATSALLAITLPPLALALALVWQSRRAGGSRD